MIEENLRTLIQKNSVLTYLLPKLSHANIRYGLYAGAHVAVLTNNRVPTDVDLLVHDEDLLKLSELFPFAKTKDLGDGVFLYIGEEDIVEFMGSADVVKDGRTYPFRLTDEAAAKLVKYDVNGLEVKMVDPVDSILLKSLLQRGADQGKHDIEDIEAVLKTVEIDTPYLRKRLEEVNGLELASPVFLRLGVQL
jgi:predicted nucleotidyltransferase